MENLNDMGISQIRIKWGLYTIFYQKIAQIFHSYKKICNHKKMFVIRKLNAAFQEGIMMLVMSPNYLLCQITVHELFSLHEKVHGQ